jgi:hypothetical protein
MTATSGILPTTPSAYSVEFVDIAGTQRIITQSRYASWSIILDIPTADISLVTAYFNRDVTTDPLNGTALHYASTGDDILVGKNVGLLRVLSEPGIIGNGPTDPDLRCDMKSTYNTGWMNGDIKGAFLSDTDDTDLVGAELVTNGRLIRIRRGGVTQAQLLLRYLVSYKSATKLIRHQPQPKLFQDLWWGKCMLLQPHIPRQEQGEQPLVYHSSVSLVKTTQLLPP